MIHTLLSLCKQSFGWLGTCWLVLLLVLTGCTDREEQYERPSWLEPPIYDVLTERGNFSLYLHAVDKTLYSSILKGAANYTVFAPNDEAFRHYLSEHNYSSIDEVPVEVLTKIVAYSMVFNRFESARLGDVLSSSVWEEGSSVKKRTSYYKTLYRETIDGKEQWVVDSPADVTTVLTPYKYLPILTSTYFSQGKLLPVDYETFFQGTAYSGLHAAAGSVINKDIYAENGIIHEVSAVNEPLDNLDEMLKANGREEFRNVLETKVGDSYLFMSYLLGENTTEVYKKLYPDRNISAVYCKTYLNLPYLLNNEDYKGTETATTEQQGYTLLVPSNEAVTQFEETVLARARVEKISDLSLTTLGYFLKAHMVDRIIWPSQFANEQNTNGEFLNGEGIDGPRLEDCVTGSHFASNGVLYDTKEVVKSKYFNTVYSEILLNEDCRTLADVAFGKFFTGDWLIELTKSVLNGNKEVDYLLVLPSDRLLQMDGYSYDEINGKFVNEDAKNAGLSSVDDRLKRLLRMCIFQRTKGTTELEDFNGFSALGYNGYGYAVNAYGDVVRFKNNKLQGLGNILDGEEVEVEEMTDFAYNNGRVFRIKDEDIAAGKMLQYSPRKTGSGVAAWTDPTLYSRIASYTEQNSDCRLFKQYMDRVYGGSAPSFIKSGTFYTVLIPTDAAIQAAVTAGKIPALPAGSAEFSTEEKPLVERFLQLCFLSGTVVVDDGLPYMEPGKNKSLSLTTAYKLTAADVDLWSANTLVDVYKDESNSLKFRFQDIKSNNWVKVEGTDPISPVRGEGKSNYMGPLSVIHAVDGIIWFKTNPQK